MTAASAIAVWDIVRFDFPFPDQAARRRWRALAIAAPAATDAFAVLWVLMIASAANESWPLDVPVSDLALGGLTHACVVRVGKVTTLDSRLARRGSVSSRRRTGRRSPLVYARYWAP